VLSSFALLSHCYDEDEHVNLLETASPRLFTVRGKSITHCKPRSKPRSERAQEREGPLTCMAFGYKLAFFPRTTLHHLNMQASSR
jgi:hypothetical protein